MNIKKEVKLINKVKRLLTQLGHPRYLHHFGPKTYEFYEHLTALFIRAYCRLSYRRVVYFTEMIGIICPSKSALQYTADKLRGSFWDKLIGVTSGKPNLAAIDSTGLSRTNPSYYYLRRIDGKMPKVHVKLSVMFDVIRKKFCSTKIRVIPAHDCRDAKILLRRVKPSILVADKGYDANWLHEYCFSEHVEAHIPMREYGKSRNKRMSKRRLAAKIFDREIYHKRELIESGFSSIKRKFGSSVSSKRASTIKSDIYSRLVCHNIFQMLLLRLRTEPFIGTVKLKA